MDKKMVRIVSIVVVAALSLSVVATVIGMFTGM